MKEIVEDVFWMILAITNIHTIKYFEFTNISLIVIWVGFNVFACLCMGYDLIKHIRDMNGKR